MKGYKEPGFQERASASVRTEAPPRPSPPNSPQWATGSTIRKRSTDRPLLLLRTQAILNRRLWLQPDESRGSEQREPTSHTTAGPSLTWINAWRTMSPSAQLRIQPRSVGGARACAPLGKRPVLGHRECEHFFFEFILIKRNSEADVRTWPAP
jgi:hypothetical protein